jgi:hypothetical protein
VPAIKTSEPAINKLQDEQQRKAMERLAKLLSNLAPKTLAKKTISLSIYYRAFEMRSSTELLKELHKSLQKQLTKQVLRQDGVFRVLKKSICHHREYQVLRQHPQGLSSD